MPETSLSIPKRIMIAGTRVAVGIGLGWLLSRKRRDTRRGALLAFNVINTFNVSNTLNVTNTFPIVMNIATKPDSRLEHPAA